MEVISLKLDEQMLKNIDAALQKNNFSTRTEFVRAAIREKLSELEKQEALKRLVLMRGSLKGKAKMSDEEAKIALSKELAKEFGVNLK
jgi:metal-responsive CopG/Arc/MetJ family transcriptional regulator